MQTLQFIILGYCRDETDPDGQPCVLCLRPLDHPSGIVRVYIDESLRQTLAASHRLGEWAGDFFDALIQLRPMQSSNQIKRFVELSNLNVGPIRTLRTGTVRVSTEPDSSLEFGAALQFALTEAERSEHKRNGRWGTGVDNQQS